MHNTSFSPNTLPKHIAIIMDGNGRWATEQGKPRVFGHKSGVVAVRKTIAAAAKLGVNALTLFAFSSENWRRPEKEVNALMELFITLLSSEVKKLRKQNFRLCVIGDRHRFNRKLQTKITEAEQLTAQNTGMIINIAANYGGKWDIVEATKEIARKVSQGELDTQSITEAVFTEHLALSELPDVELLIRTSGECRLSNFMLWQMAYAEIYFTPVYWPEFDEQSLLDAVAWFVNRERRFGSTGEQTQSNHPSKEQSYNQCPKKVTV